MLNSLIGVCSICSSTYVFTTLFHYYIFPFFLSNHFSLAL